MDFGEFRSAIIIVTSLFLAIDEENYPSVSCRLKTFFILAPVVLCGAHSKQKYILFLVCMCRNINLKYSIISIMHVCVCVRDCVYVCECV